MTYLSSVLADAPVHFWRCADPGGLVLQDIGSAPYPLAGVNGVVSGQLGYSGPNTDGGSYLAQATSYLQSVNTLAANNRFTIELFCWPVGAYGAANQYLAGFDGAAAASVWLALTANMSFSSAYNGVRATEATTNRQGAWHHVAVSYDGTNLRLYVDGALQQTSAVASLATANNVFFLNRRSGAGNFYVGFLSEVAWYASALTLARISAHSAAADNTAVRPSYAQSGTLSLTSGLPPLGATGLEAILDSVRKTY